MPVPMVSSSTVPLKVSPGAEALLGDGRRVGIVERQDRPAQLLLEQLRRVHADPALVDVRRGQDHAGS